MTTPEERKDVTVMLEAIAVGDREAAERLLPIVYDELRGLAHAYLRGERAGNTLQPTALVHEAYLRLVGSAGAQSERWNGRQHFFATAATAMRRILVDRAREKQAKKRGGSGARIDGARAGDRVDLENFDGAAENDTFDLIALDDALKRFECVDPRRAQVVMLRYFAGLNVDETAVVLGVSPATVKNDWAFARAWLLRQLAGT